MSTHDLIMQRLIIVVSAWRNSTSLALKAPGTFVFLFVNGDAVAAVLHKSIISVH